MTWLEVNAAPLPEGVAVWLNSSIASPWSFFVRWEGHVLFWMLANLALHESLASFYISKLMAWHQYAASANRYGRTQKHRQLHGQNTGELQKNT